MLVTSPYYPPLTFLNTKNLAVSTCIATKQLPPPGWSTPTEAVESVFSPTSCDLGNSTTHLSLLQGYLHRAHFSLGLGAAHQVGTPIHVYALYENAFRAHYGQSMQANHEESARLYAAFSKVAQHNEFAWNEGKADTVEVIGTVGKKNRMVCFPCTYTVLDKLLDPADILTSRLHATDPLLMNAFNTVNLASAIILTSTTFAQSLGIPASQWIYPLGGAGTQDADEFWNRPNFHSSPSLSRSIDASLRVSGIEKQDIDVLDIYSCFPVVPKIAARHLGVPITGGQTRLSLLGGLTSFGGAGNNYSTHALTAMTRCLRQGKATTGLVLCNGGMMTSQYAVVLSNTPPTKGVYPLENPLPPQLTDVATPDLALRAEGHAVVEVCVFETM